MDDGGRRHKGAKWMAAGSRSERHQSRRGHSSEQRRPLKTIALTPPDFKVNSQLLLESYLEKPTQFAGVVSNVPVELDATNRSNVLRQIDRGKCEGSIIWSTTYEHDAIFCLSAQNVKISKRDGREELLLRLPIHEIAAICYVRDDDQHILAIKFNDEEDVDEAETTSEARDSTTCHLAVLYSDTKMAAEELCALIGQCFQLVYTEATMQFFDRNLNEMSRGMSVTSSTLRSDQSSNSSPRRQSDRKNFAFLSQSSLDLDQANGTLSSDASHSMADTYRRYSSTARSSGDTTAAVAAAADMSTLANSLIQEYMEKLQTKLNADELRQFARLLMAWHTNRPFSEFCDKVLELYGPNRKYLLAGMQPFIPEREASYFEAFLERIGLTSVVPASNRAVSTPAYRRSVSASHAVAPLHDDSVNRTPNTISGDLSTAAARFARDGH